MVTRNIASVIVLTLLVVGCSADLPTTALYESDSEAAFAKAERSTEVIIWEDTQTDHFYLPCLGEDAELTASYRWITSVVETPSGNANYNGYLLAWDGTIVGDDSGDIWYLDAWRAKLQMHEMANGAFILVEPVKEEYHKDDGETMKMTSVWKEKNGVLDFQFKSCSRRGAK